MGQKIFGSALIQPARSICVSLSAFFIITAAVVTGKETVKEVPRNMTEMILDFFSLHNLTS